MCWFKRADRPDGGTRLYGDQEVNKNVLTSVTAEIRPLHALIEVNISAVTLSDENLRY